MGVGLTPMRVVVAVGIVAGLIERIAVWHAQVGALAARLLQVGLESRSHFSSILVAILLRMKICILMGSASNALLS